MKNLTLLNDNTNIKLNDTGTVIQFKASNEGQPVGLSNGQSAIFRIKNELGFLKSVNASTSYGGYVFELDTEDLSGLVPGTYQVELLIQVDSDNALIFPDKGFVQFTINANALNITGEQLPVMSLEDFKDELKTYVDNQTIQATTNIKNDFDTYVDNLTDSTITTATKASQDAQTAIDTANTAKNTADTAKSTADSASQTATTAQSTAETAKSTADSINGKVDLANENALNALNTVNSALDDFGGRNYLLDSKTRSKAGLWTYPKGEPNAQGTFLNSNVVTDATEWSKQMGIYNTYNLVEREIFNTNDYFVFSVYVKKDENLTLSDGDIRFFSGPSTDSDDAHPDITNVSSFWTQIYVKFKFANVNIPSNAWNYGLRFEVTRSFSDGNIYFACPKLEKGTIPTDYTPAPEDLDSQIASIQQSQSIILTQMATIQSSINNEGSGS